MGRAFPFCCRLYVVCSIVFQDGFEAVGGDSRDYCKFSVSHMHYRPFVVSCMCQFVQQCGRF